MKSPSEKELSKRKLQDAQVRQIDSLITNLKFIRDNPALSREGLDALNRIQTELIVLHQSYGEAYMNLIREGYDTDQIFLTSITDPASKPTVAVFSAANVGHTTVAPGDPPVLIRPSPLAR